MVAVVTVHATSRPSSLERRDRRLPTLCRSRGPTGALEINEMSNLSSLQANVSIVKDKYIARLQQRMPMAIQDLAATIATRATSSSSDASSTRREKSGRS